MKNYLFKIFRTALGRNINGKKVNTNKTVKHYKTPSKSNWTQDNVGAKRGNAITWWGQALF